MLYGIVLCRRELHRFGISVHIIEPGAHATAIAATMIKSTQRAWDEASDEVRTSYGGENYFSKSW